MLLQPLKLSIICALLPAGMVARQLLRTFMADSATAAGVRTSSHAGDRKKEWIMNDAKRQGVKKCTETSLQDKKVMCLTFSAAGHGALKGTGDRLPGLLLSRSLFQRYRADQLTIRRGGLSNSNGKKNSHDEKIEQKDFKSRPKEKSNHRIKKSCVTLSVFYKCLHSCLTFVNLKKDPACNFFFFFYIWLQLKLPSLHWNPLSLFFNCILH